MVSTAGQRGNWCARPGSGDGGVHGRAAEQLLSPVSLQQHKLLQPQQVGRRACLVSSSVQLPGLLPHAQPHTASLHRCSRMRLPRQPHTASRHATAHPPTACPPWCPRHPRWPCFAWAARCRPRSHWPLAAASWARRPPPPSSPFWPPAWRLQQRLGREGRGMHAPPSQVQQQAWLRYQCRPATELPATQHGGWAGAPSAAAKPAHAPPPPQSRPAALPCLLNMPPEHATSACLLAAPTPYLAWAWPAACA